MNVLSTSTQQNPNNAPQLPFESACPEIEGPCDRVKNHAVLCGAKVAKADDMGHFAGKTGFVQHVNVNATVTGKASLFFVSYQVIYSDGERACLTPTELFQELLLYRQHGISFDGESRDHQLNATDKHILNLTILSEAVREVNVLNRPVCRYISDRPTNEDNRPRPCTGLVTNFRIACGTPMWVVSYESRGIKEEIGKDQLDTELKTVREYLALEATDNGRSNADNSAISSTRENSPNNTL